MGWWPHPVPLSMRQATAGHLVAHAQRKNMPYREGQAVAGMRQLTVPAVSLSGAAPRDLLDQVGRETTNVLQVSL